MSPSKSCRRRGGNKHGGQIALHRRVLVRRQNGLLRGVPANAGRSARVEEDDGSSASPDRERPGPAAGKAGTGNIGLIAHARQSRWRRPRSGKPGFDKGIDPCAGIGRIEFGADALPFRHVTSAVPGVTRACAPATAHTWTAIEAHRRRPLPESAAAETDRRTYRRNRAGSSSHCRTRRR